MASYLRVVCETKVAGMVVLMCLLSTLSVGRLADAQTRVHLTYRVPDGWIKRVFLVGCWKPFQGRHYWM